MADARIEAFGIGEEFTDGVIGKVTGAGKDSLLDDPGIGPDLEHVEVGIGFEDEAIGLAGRDSDVIGQVAKVRAEGKLFSLGVGGDGDWVEAIDAAVDSGEAGESFALSKTGVNEDASGFRLEQG